MLSLCSLSSLPSISSLHPLTSLVQFSFRSHLSSRIIRLLTYYPVSLLAVPTVPIISYVGVWPLWGNFIVTVFFTAISLQSIAEIVYSCIILSNKHLSFTCLLISPDRPNDRWTSWGSFHCKKVVFDTDLRQRGLNYPRPMYINDLFRVLLSFQTTEGH